MVRRALLAQEDSLRSHRERTAELSALSAEIAHELKNPLASVKGLAGLLAPALADDPKSAERLAVLRREVDRLQSILDEFLNFSRPLVPLALGSADVGALAREVAALHEGMARERGLLLEVRGQATARCDPRKVKQVLINLVQNALDASAPGGTVEVDVAGRRRRRPGGRAWTAGPVSTRGSAERVFEPGVTTKAGGSGIGLTVARALARQHGGELRLSRPAPGEASSPSCCCPRAPVARRRRRERAATSRPRVLVVDDDPGVRYTLREILDSEGLEVAEAEDGLRRSPRSKPRPDLVLTDLRMPRLDGMDLLRAWSPVTPAARGAHHRARLGAPGGRGHQGGGLRLLPQALRDRGAPRRGAARRRGGAARAENERLAGQLALSRTMVFTSRRHGAASRLWWRGWRRAT